MNLFSVVAFEYRRFSLAEGCHVGLYVSACCVVSFLYIITCEIYLLFVRRLDGILYTLSYFVIGMAKSKWKHMKEN